MITLRDTIKFCSLKFFILVVCKKNKKKKKKKKKKKFTNKNNIINSFEKKPIKGGTPAIENNNIVIKNKINELNVISLNE